MISYKLYAITDRNWLKHGETLGDAVEQAILGGATFVQLREKILKGEELKTLAVSVQEVCRKYGIPFVINDDVRLAKEIDADGVHVGQSDMAIEEARKILGPKKIIGVTAKTVEQARAAEERGADYLGSGAVFGTSTKLDARPMSMELLNEICECVSIPVVAIGGINSENVGRLKGTKIAGPAVVSGIFAGRNVKNSAREIYSNFHGRPIIHCITNYVTVNQVANMILTHFGSPICAHNINEVEEVQENATALLINLGATDDYEAIRLAYRKALAKGHITVIDPVGVSGITFRRDFLDELLELGSPTCIRGNYSEILAIYKSQNTGSGLDCIESGHIETVSKLASRLKCVVVATGETDMISDGRNSIVIDSGHSLQKRLTGSGCMLSAAICTELAFSKSNRAIKPIDVIANTCRHLGDAAKLAALETIEEGKGIMTFQTKWFDRLSI